MDLAVYLPAVSAFLGGLLGAAGGVVVAIYNQRNETLRKEASFYREKLSDLSVSVDDCALWEERAMYAKTPSSFKDLKDIDKSRKMVTLCSLYFPNILELAVDYHNQLRLYGALLAQTASKVGESPTLYFEYPEVLAHVRGPLRSSRYVLEKSLHEEAARIHIRQLKPWRSWLREMFGLSIIGPPPSLYHPQPKAKEPKKTSQEARQEKRSQYTEEE
jgi:hypothetical protein